MLLPQSGDLAGHYTIDHTAGTYVFGRRQAARGCTSSTPRIATVVAADIKALLAGK